MKITILNGNPDNENTGFDNYLNEISTRLHSNNHTVSILQLRDMDIKHCVGCFGCWVKTPGRCAAKDDSYIVCRESVNSELVIFSSPIIMGFTTALLKKTHDKMIPLLLPYNEIVNNECHHFARYDKYPKLGLLLEKDNKTDDDDIEIITDIYKRDAVNLKSSLSFIKFMSDSIEEVENEINNI